MANRLASESSPYLLQHADNPVDWRPWGAEAFEAARREGKPVFLSVGYSSCHWCHVMERESFSDAATAEVLNRHFVPVKVDREERPDVDSVYMAAVQALTGSGGWPMSVFLTPEGAPFFGGTYYPPRRSRGMPSFREVLAAVARAWEERPEEVRSAGEGLAAALRASVAVPPAGGEPLDPDVPERAVYRLASAFDAAHGGFDGAPKFPQPLVVDFLLARHAATGDPLPLRMAEGTLSGMMRGGIRDPLGGGFHRYAVDAAWRVPHFEKMLSDNALLARSYLRGWLATGDGAYRRVAEETLDWMLREMAAPEGYLCASLDADAEGEEGRHYAWSRDAVRDALSRAPGGPFPPEDADLFLAAHGADGPEDFEGGHVLRLARDAGELAAERGLAAADASRRLARMREALLAARERRPKPSRDDKAVAAWNGLALSALAEGARFLGRDDFRAAAEGVARFLLGPMAAGPGALYRSWRNGSAKVPGFLEDHACAAEGLLDLYQATFDARWFVAARELCEAVLARFADGSGGFLDAAAEHEALVAPARTIHDGAVPSGGAVTCSVLLRLAAFTGEGRYADAARSALAPLQGAMGEAPLAFGRWLSSLEAALAAPVAVAVVGRDARPLLEALAASLPPHAAVAWGDGGASPVPLLAGRPPGPEGRAAAYVCRNFACEAPVTGPAELAALLRRPSAAGAAGKG